MIDWLSSKVALSVAALMLLASAGGAFELVKARNEEAMLEECASGIARMLWSLNDSGEGSQATLYRGEADYPHEVLGDPLSVRLYPGLVVVDAGGRSASAVIPMMAAGPGMGGAPWSGDGLLFEKRGGVLTIAACQSQS